ncbi:DNA-binding transcriptional regulator FruR [Gilliamella sp. Fer1-1]|jgi:LacI family transcriptional regulator, fructose operon transcriptional repressor|uniref:catabolite repressor/activator n=1 Tax=unclassified Gilliamella TaxID=2685620 RepID=UPI00080E6B34|nr:catabolite repressor/activator [Gilliamella apicola]OCG28729.1 DNA-binding transcriptional regulator FruR [Gilliamella apicola]OCG30131.1 DNA-binding transcriptional regulator FruR [Gilliamella apicola]OCG34847.1 DNA-binding transcriptional regulator FruR [Gilliamella apicola]OCG39950.1 DNA-binding transcriptional regulator FruR [Gilliamella apicola]
MKLEEIAFLAGVSRTTASYVVNGKAKTYRVSDKTIEKVMSVVKEYNYQPNAVAAGLRAGKTRTIGIIIPDLENNSYTRIANYLEQLVRKEGYQLLLSCSEDNPLIEKECVKHLQQRRVDALVISSSFVSEQDYAFYDDWQNSVIPLFALDRTLSTATFRNIVGADKQDAKTLASTFSRFVTGAVAYIGALPNLSVSQLRMEGFKEVASARFNQVDFLCAHNYSRHDAEVAFSYWLETHDIPDGIFTTSFSLLQGAIDSILKKFGHLPDNLTIATFGDNELLDFLPCKVISLSQDHKEVSEVTIKLLLDSLHKKSYESGTTVIPRRLIYRGSLSRICINDK